MAERGGFEPPVRFYPYNGLANRPFRPLRHLSNPFLANELSMNPSAQHEIQILAILGHFLGVSWG